MAALVGVLGLLAGAAYAITGGWLAFAGAASAYQFEGDPVGGLGPLLQIIAGFVAAVGVALLLQGVLALAAGVGVLRRRPWGRVLGLCAAALAVLWGLLFVIALDGGAYRALGAAQIAFGVFAGAVLIREGGEFSRPWD
jgi:hypothetical protein